MAAYYYNITGELTQNLLESSGNEIVSKILLTNVEGTNKCTVDLYIEKAITGKFYLLKGVELPIGATLMHNNININNSAGQYGLFIKLTKSASETPAVDVILS